MANNIKSIVFDSGPIISLTLNNLLWLLKPLKRSFGGEFYITETVYFELVERPMQTKKYKFEALQVLPLIADGTIVVLKDADIKSQAERFLNLANHCFKAQGQWISIVHPGEMEVLAAAHLYQAEAIIIDERTTRDLIENPRLIDRHLEKKLHINVDADAQNIRQAVRQFSSIPVLRSFELVAIAYELGLLSEYMQKSEEIVVPNIRQAVLEGILWAVKLSGCSVREEDIAKMIRLVKTPAIRC